MSRSIPRLERQLLARVAEVLGVPSTSELQLGESVDGLASVKSSGRSFVIECRSSGSAAPVAMALDRLRSVRGQLRGKAVPLVAVPFMGPVGQRLCAEAGVGWIDFSGNSHIEVPGLRVHVEGKPNRFIRPGRPANAFAPRSARVARHLLLAPDRPQTQRQIAQATGLTESYVSRVVGRLEELRLLTRDDKGGLRPKDPPLLLDAWSERYDFFKHEILRGHISTPSTDELTRRLAGAFTDAGIGYAATALPAAWLRDQFARFRIVTIYLHAEPPAKLLEDLGFREGSRGANLWLVLPNDGGVFHGTEEVEGIQCVSVVQTYVDLLHHAERAADAAEHLKDRWLRQLKQAA